MAGIAGFLCLAVILFINPACAWAGESASAPQPYLLCLNFTTTNYIKWLLGEQRNLDRFPHVFISLEEASGRPPAQQLASAGFYIPNRILAEKLEPYQVENGAHQECVPLGASQGEKCVSWINDAKEQVRRAEGALSQRAPAPRLQGVIGTPPLPKAFNYNLLFNNCANFVSRAWKGCSGQEIKDKSWFPRALKWPPALRVAE